MLWTCHGHVLDMSWTCLGHALDILQYVLDMSWTWLGNPSDMYWLWSRHVFNVFTCFDSVLNMFWIRFQYVLDMFRICFGYALDMFWTCLREVSGHVWGKFRLCVTGSPGKASNLGLTGSRGFSLGAVTIHHPGLFTTQARCRPSFFTEDVAHILPKSIEWERILMSYVRHKKCLKWFHGLKFD